MNDTKVIFGKKTKNQILNDAENRLVQTIVGNLIWITGIIILMILSNTNLDKTIGLIVLFISFISASAMILLGLRCPFCDSIKWYEKWESKYFRVNKWNFKCEHCNLTNEQINEIIDMLKRGVEINADTIARFNHRDL